MYYHVASTSKGRLGTAQELCNSPTCAVGRCSAGRRFSGWSDHTYCWYRATLLALLCVLGCDRDWSHKVQHVSMVDCPKNLRSLVALSDPSAPNDVLTQWRMPAPIEKTQMVTINQDAIVDLEGSEVFDLAPYIIDERLRLALARSTRLKWLRMPKYITPADLRCVCAARHLRGLSIPLATLREADLSLFSDLEDLQWLDLSYADLPTSDGAGFPYLPRLEVLYVDCAHFGRRRLPDLREFPKLRVLCARRWVITDDGLTKLVDGSPELEYLNLAFIQGITSDSVPQLAKLRHLKYLHIGCTTLEEQLGACTAEHVQRHLPTCFIGVGD